MHHADNSKETSPDIRKFTELLKRAQNLQRMNSFSMGDITISVHNETIVISHIQQFGTVRKWLRVENVYT